MERRKKQVANRLPRTLLRAKANWDQGRFDEALRLFNEAVRETPNNIDVLIAAARALGARYQVERSVALLERAHRLGPRRADVQHLIGESYALVGHSTEAEACFRRACLLAATPRSQFELAKICERRHALDEATELIAKVLRADPRSGPALLLLARIKRRRGEMEKAQALLRQLTADARRPPLLLSEAYGEMSLLLDAMGQFDSAWDAILKCKQILQAQDAAAWTAAQFVLGRCQRMVEALSADHFARWQRMPAGALPQRLALLTGFPRAGTTLLEQVLDAHPQVISSEEKEVFSAEIFAQLGEGRLPNTPIERLLDELTEQQIAGARAAYLGAMEGMLCEPIGARLHVDKNPAMNLMIPVMRRVFPELKLVIALRDPRDVILSCFLRYLPVNPVSVCFLTLERTVERFMLDLGAWLKMRDMTGNWVEVRYEQTVADLPQEAGRVLFALSLPWDDAVLQYRKQAISKPVRSPSYEEVVRPIFTSSIGRWQNYERYLAPVLNKLSPLVKSLGYET